MTHPLCDKYVTYEKYVFRNVNPTILPCNTGVGTKTARVAGADREMALADDVTIRGTPGDVTYYDREHPCKLRQHSE